MDEQTFIQLADGELARIEAALDKAGQAGEAGEADFEVETRPGGVLEIECGNGSKIIINRHVAAREIWVAAKSGGYHFRLQNGDWVATRDGETLWFAIQRVLSEQTGEQVRFP
jgi:CyaY protein